MNYSDEEIEMIIAEAFDRGWRYGLLFAVVMIIFGFIITLIK